MKTALFTLLMLLAAPLRAEDFDLGGEIGNPFRGYVSPSRVFGTIYPKSWNVLERHAAVSFNEGANEQSNAVAINVQEAPGVQSHFELARKLIRENPGENWREIAVQGRPALMSETGGRGSVFSLIRPNVILVTRFQTRSDTQSKEFVRKVIYSVKTP